jgi:exodeoxyribonuclease VII small subunit
VEKNIKKAKAQPTFETALKDLETIADRLEEGTLSLDKSIDEFERGIRLARFCHSRLEEAEKKIEILQKGDDGKIKKVQIKTVKDSGDINDDDDIQGTLL